MLINGLLKYLKEKEKTPSKYFKILFVEPRTLNNFAPNIGVTVVYGKLIQMVDSGQNLVKRTQITVSFQMQKQSKE
jgi:hypothetical protein